MTQKPFAIESAKTFFGSQPAAKEIAVAGNECRLARQGERLVARGVLADVVVTVQVPAAGFAAMLRFRAPEEQSVSRERVRMLCEFADQALSLLFESVHAMEISPRQVVVSAMGGSDVAGLTYGRGKQLSQAVVRSLCMQGVVTNGTDLGGTQARAIWLESSSGRLIVRSSFSPLSDSVDRFEHGPESQPFAPDLFACQKQRSSRQF